ncbi:MAG: hypothetical protein N2439_09505 [Anaerolineae bacterium]|nr:hypothetical protein [Anaerolineae bacterium]
MELRGMVNTVDRTMLIVLAILWVIYIFWLEEWFRGSIRAAREQRMRARLLNEGQPVLETGWQRWNLHLLLHRVRSAIMVPAVTLVIYLMLLGISWLILH